MIGTLFALLLTASADLRVTLPTLVQPGADSDAPPILVVSAFPPLATPGMRNPVPVRYFNAARRDATGATITITVPRALGFGPLPANCTSEGNTASCETGVIPGTGPNGERQYPTITVEPILPPEHETVYAVLLDIRGHDEGTAPSMAVATLTTARAFFVTNTEDSGAGSLRDTIATAAPVCRGDVQCQIAFRIDSPDAVKTIRLRSPIPRIIATRMLIDATTQTRHSGDTNPHGPEVEIDGAALREGDGLDLQIDCSAEVRGFAINGFPGYGLVLRSPDCNRGDLARRIHENYIGTDPTGTRAVPNQRGIYVDVPLTGSLNQFSPWSITNNVISGNRRAGIWVENAAVMEITGNTIGLDAMRTAGLGNGASGIFINRGGFGTDIFQNFIGFNGHAGISIASGAQYVAVYANSIQANAQGGIDWNLDGPSPTSYVPTPVITIAQYDPVTKTTLIRGSSTARATFNTDVFLYASDAPDPDGYGEGQYYLGSVRILPGPFEARVGGDWRGKWVSAVAMENLYYGFLLAGPVEGNGVRYDFRTTTSEFGNAVKVE